MVFVFIEERAPNDHLLCKVDQVIEFDFIRDKFKDFYFTDNKRTELDLVALFKILFIGYLFIQVFISDIICLEIDKDVLFFSN